MANESRNPQSDDSNRRMDEDEQVRGIADEGDDAFESDDDEDIDDEEEEEEEGGTF